jgi:hypothetical protein
LLARRLRRSRWESLKRLVRRKRDGALAEEFPASCFDGLAYLQANPDVAEAVACGRVGSALAHYCRHGYQERRPFALAITRDANAGYPLDIARSEAMRDSQARIVALGSELSADTIARLTNLRSEISHDADSRATALRAEMSADAEARAARAGKRAAEYVDASLAALRRADETRQRDLSFQLDALRGGAGEMQKELAATQDELHRLHEETRSVTSRLGADMAALAARLEASIEKIRVVLPGFALAPELEATRMEVGKAASGLEVLRTEIRRLDQFAREGMERLYAQTSVLESASEARERDWCARLSRLDDSYREALEGVKEAVSTLARVSDSRTQDVSSRVELLRAQAGDITTTMTAAAAALDAMQGELRRLEQTATDGIAGVRAEMSAGLAVAARADDLARLGQETQQRLEQLKGEVSAEAARANNLHGELQSRLERLQQETSKAARSEDLERVKRDALHDLERLRSEITAASAMREVRDQGTLQQIEWLRNSLHEAQGKLAAAARVEDVERLRRDSGQDLDRVRSEIGSIAALQKARESAFAAQIDTVKAEVDGAKVRAELAEAKVTSVQRELGAETWQIAGTVSQLGNKVESAHSEVTKIQQELGSVKTNAARIVNPHLNMLNVLGYQAHSRLLARADAEKLAKHWAPLLGLKVEEKELFYLAHRVGNIESVCAGRLAASVNDILLRILVARAVKARSVDILEIGTLFGLGISALHEALAPLYERVQFTVIDPLEGFYGAANKDILTGVPVNKTVFEENLRRTGVQSDKVQLVQHLSTDPQALAEASRNRYDVVIIDGDHTYAGVKNDTEKFVATAKPGAYVIFDDYGNQHWPDVKKYVDGEVLPRKDLKFVGAEWHTAVCQVSAEAA